MTNPLFKKSSTVMIVVLFAGCASLPPAPFPEPPQEWKMVTDLEHETGDCRFLAGSYSMVSESLSHTGRSWQLKDKSRFSPYSGFIGPAEAAGIPRSSVEKADWKFSGPPNDGYFQLRFEGTTELFFDYFVNKDNTIYSYHFSSHLKQFSCEIGTIKFPVAIDLSGGEGVQANSQRSRSIGVNIIGDLILFDLTSQANWAFNRLDPTILITKFPRGSGD